MSRLDEVISKYAMMQDKSEEGERQKRRARLLGTNPSGSPKASLDSGEVRKGSHLSQRSCLPPALATRDSRGPRGAVCGSSERTKSSGVEPIYGLLT